LLTFSVAIPSAVKVFNWVATLYKGSIRFTTPMMYALGFILLFTIGGLTGLFLGALQVDIPLHDTYFVIAHFHYVAMGSMLFAFLAGMYYWFPKIFGKMFNDRVGIIASIIIFFGFNLTFFPQFIAGSHGLPRRYANYPVEFQIYHVLSTIGAYTMTSGLLLVLINWIQALRNGPKAPPNPWGGNTLEWRCASPPPHDNFAVAPVADDPYDLTAWEDHGPVIGWVKKEQPAEVVPLAARAH
jgi:cytochrome c oxidase subunit 1